MDMDPLPPIPAPLCAATALSENRYISTFPQLIQHNYRAPFLTTNHYVVGSLHGRKKGKETTSPFEVGRYVNTFAVSLT